MVKLCLSHSPLEPRHILTQLFKLPDFKRGPAQRGDPPYNFPPNQIQQVPYLSLCWLLGTFDDVTATCDITAIHEFQEFPEVFLSIS